jgi:hypothetical protein
MKELLLLTLIGSSLFLSVYSQDKVIAVETLQSKISLVGEGAQDEYIFEVKTKSNNNVQQFVLPLRTSRIVQVSIYNDSLQILGELYHGGDVCFVVNTSTMKVADSIWGYRMTFSQDRRFAVFNRHYPRSQKSGMFAQDVVCIYDFQKSAEQNRLALDFVSDPTRAGIPVYPIFNLIHKDLNNILEDEQLVSRVTSPFLWIEKKLICIFLSWHDGYNYIVLVDLSKGIASPMAVEKRLDRVADLIENTKVIVVKSITLEDERIHVETFLNFSPKQDCKISIDLQRVQ